MNNILYEYKKSPRRFALEIFSVALTFPLSIYWMLHYIPVEPPIDQYVLGGAMACGLLLFLFFGLPNWKHSKPFRFCISKDTIICDNPAKGSTSYQINTQDLKELNVQIKLGGGNSSYWYFLVTKNGERFVIPNALTLSPFSVSKVIQKHFPDLPVIQSKGH